MSCQALIASPPPFKTFQIHHSGDPDLLKCCKPDLDLNCQHSSVHWNQMQKLIGPVQPNTIMMIIVFSFMAF